MKDYDREHVDDKINNMMTLKPEKQQEYLKVYGDLLTGGSYDNNPEMRDYFLERLKEFVVV